MSSNQPYPPSNNPPYPPQQQLNQYPPPTFNYDNYGSAYPTSSNQSPYPPPVETVPPTNPAFPPPPSYDTAVGEPKPAGSAPTPYYTYQTQPIPQTAPPSYPPTSSYVEYEGSAFHDRIISFDDKTIRLGMFLFTAKTDLIFTISYSSFSSFFMIFYFIKTRNSSSYRLY